MRCQQTCVCVVAFVSTDVWQPAVLFRRTTKPDSAGLSTWRLLMPNPYVYSEQVYRSGNPTDYNVSRGFGYRNLSSLRRVVGTLHAICRRHAAFSPRVEI